jgi:DNA invertase Pin-like site-specific DNA recombinase
MNNSDFAFSRFLNLSIYTLYTYILKRIRKTGIRWLLIFPFILLYITLCGSNISLSTHHHQTEMMALFLSGNYSHLKDLRWAIVKRVSTSSQGHGPSLEEQGNQTYELVEYFDGKMKFEFEMEESATTLDNETFDELRKLAKKDEFDVLAVSQLNRLTRADPMEAFEFMQVLCYNDVILCTAENGPYEWDDPDDFDEITTQIVLARKHVLDIREGQKRNWRPKFQAKKWPQGKSGPTLIRLVDVGDEYDLMKLKDGAEIVANEIYDKYIETQNLSETHRYIKNQLPIGEIESLSYSQVRNLVGNRQLTGRFPRTDEVLAHHEDLRVISDDKFEKATELRKSDNTSEQEDPLESTEALSAYAQRFGPLHTILNVLTRFRPICQDCSSIMEWDGDKTGQSLGVTVPKFECSECNNDRSIPSKDAMEQMVDVLPLRCPLCCGTNEFTAEEIKTAGAVFDYQYRCNLCEETWGLDKSPNEIKRVLDNPKLKFSINDDSLEPNRDDDEKQRDLGDFA